MSSRFASSPSVSAQGQNEWVHRQEMMERWYQDAITTEWVSRCFSNDYDPLRPLMTTYHGTILDLGGGHGIARHYLPATVRYVSLDPSVMWLDREWRTLAADYPCLIDRPPFVQAVGEALPFRRCAFDVVLALWSLNHVRDPAQVFDEVRRVLKPGGRFLIVLEDAEPRWRDLLRPPFRGERRKDTAHNIARKLRTVLPGQAWELQPDHIRIRESQLLHWAGADLAVRTRAWIGKYLTYEYVRRADGGA